MDFFQQGPSALHHLDPSGDAVRRLVREAAAQRNAALVLPMLHEEMSRPAIRTIRDGLRRMDHLHELVVPLTATDEAQVEEVRRFFSQMPFQVHVIWCEGKRVTEVLRGLADRGLDLTGFEGKGLAVWLGLGAASEESHAIAIHDADIENYAPLLVDRLLAPVMSEEMDFFFAKGYYARLTGGRLYGRVVRLFVWPFLDALQTVLQRPSPLVSYLRSFRYPLSGEMAFTSDLARNVRVPTDWGLELGLLGEVHRNASAKRICQVDLGLYSHKHKKIGTARREGLQRMVAEIGTNIFRLIAGMEGAQISREMLIALRVAYRREAQDAIRRYAADSLVNGLAYDRHEEETTAERFERLIEESGNQFLQHPLADQISEWMRAISADPESPARVRLASLPRADQARLTDAARAGG